MGDTTCREGWVRRNHGATGGGREHFPSGAARERSAERGCSGPSIGNRTNTGHTPGNGHTPGTHRETDIYRAPGTHRAHTGHTTGTRRTPGTHRSHTGHRVHTGHVPRSGPRFALWAGAPSRQSGRRLRTVPVSPAVRVSHRGVWHGPRPAGAAPLCTAAVGSRSIPPRLPFGFGPASQCPRHRQRPGSLRAAAAATAARARARPCPRRPRTCR